MSDRTTNIWGERTPFGAGTTWPERVDAYLTVDDSEVERWVPSACVLCSNDCGLEIAVAGGRIVGVRGRADDRVNHGRLGPKGLYGWQANNSSDRLKRPLVRRNGSLEETDWETALGLVVERSQQLLAEDGPLAFGFYTTGQLFAEEYLAQALVARVGLGTPHLDGNTRLCTATASRRSSRASAATATPAPTPTSISATRSSSSATTSPRRRPCSGCACSTACTARTGRTSSSSTRAPRRPRKRPTSTCRSGAGRTSRS